MEKEVKTSVLADGTVIRRVFEDDYLEEKRITAINYLGHKWLMHPVNAPKKIKQPTNKTQRTRKQG